MLGSDRRRYDDYSFDIEDQYRGPYDRPYPPPRPPRKKLTFGRLLWLLISFPFRLIGKVTRNAHWFLIWPLRLFFSFALVGIVVSVIIILIYGSISNRYDISQVMKMPERTIVLDRKNREIGRLHGENRIRIKLGEIPQALKDAVIVREDSRFYDHSGVDWIGVGRALHQIYKHKRSTQGASTLTMQLAKITFSHDTRSYHYKLIEVALAKRIEATYSKDEILEAYLNRIFWGHTFLGISAAARGYFDKRPEELTLSECAMLAGIIYGPNDFSPYRHPDQAKHARDVVLKVMLEKGKITEQQYQQALGEPIVTHKPNINSEENYAMETIRRELNAILEHENIELGGLVVRTTLDLDLQNATIEAINKKLSELEDRRNYPHPTRKAYLALPEEQRKMTKPAYLQAAAVAVDNSTGAILVLVGGRDSEESSFNRAVQSQRQIGSLFKPFVYTAFFEKGYSPSSLISDDRIFRGEIRGTTNWSPRNADNTYRGMQPASFGLIKSRNTMSVRIGSIAGLSNVVDKARLAGFHSKLFMSPALFLGTLEASPLDVASAYTIFANGGVRPTPYIIESITDAGNNQMLSSTVHTSRTVFTSKAVAMTSKILQQVTQPGGTGGQTSALGFKAPCGGKTGTTNNYTNAWFAGFTSNISAAVWVGFDKQTRIMDKGYGGVLALPIWVDMMLSAEKEGYNCGLIRLTPTSPTSAILLCHVSGKLAHDGCIDAKTAYQETMPGTQSPTEICSVHVPEPVLMEDDVNIPEPELVDDFSLSEEEPELHTKTRIRDFIQDDVLEPILTDDPPTPSPQKSTSPRQETIPEPIIIDDVPSLVPSSSPPQPRVMSKPAQKAVLTPVVAPRPTSSTPKVSSAPARRVTPKSVSKSVTTSASPSKPAVKQKPKPTVKQASAKPKAVEARPASASKPKQATPPKPQLKPVLRPRQKARPRPQSSEKEDYMPNTLF